MKVGLAKVERWNLGLSAGAVAASLALETPHFATSLAAGAFLEALNLGAMRRAAVRFFAGELGGTWSAGYALRFVVLAAGIFLTLEAGAHPVALLIGLSIAMPAALIDAWLNRPPILDPATLPVLLDEESSDEARERAELAARDERLSILGRLFPTLIQPPAMSADPSSDAASEPVSAASYTDRDAARPARPDETNR